jgi:hypothetical protein
METISEDERPEAGSPDGKRNFVLGRGEGTLIACGEVGGMASEESDAVGDRGGAVISIDGDASSIGLSGVSFVVGLSTSAPKGTPSSSAPSITGVGDRGSSSGAILSTEVDEVGRVRPGSESKS